MNEPASRAPIPTVIEGLRTTSDKIRALARADYSRTEISEVLDIRYQHVRNVLVAAGIVGGLKRDIEFERPPMSVAVDPTPREPTPSSVLLSGGFRLLGEWLPSEDGEFELSAKAPIDAGVYAFVVDDCVRYVGLTQRGLRTRMDHYRRGNAAQKTSARVKKLISAALAEGKPVQVFIAIPDGAQSWNGLPVNVAAGLEAGLIRMIQPIWNMHGIRA
jgi:hypothetical protein